MKISIQSLFIVFALLTVLLSGCAPTSTPVPPTFTPSPILPTFTAEPTATATPIPPTSTPDGGLLFDDFSNTEMSNTKWVLNYETGRIKDGEMYIENGYIFGGSNTWKNYSVRATVRLISEGGHDFGIVARFRDYDNFYNCQFFQNPEIDKSSWLVITNSNLSGGFDWLVMNPATGMDVGKHDVRMDIQDENITCYLDGNVVATALDGTFPSGKFGFRVFNTEISVDAVEVYKLP